MSIDLVVFLKFAAILGGVIWLNRRASRGARSAQARRVED